VLPFPSVFPDQTTSPPTPPCDAVHDEPLIVVEHLDNKVLIIGSCSGQLLANLDVFSNPLEVDILPDGSKALVTSFDGAITFIDLTTYAIST
jgi:hypothetical protein